MTIYQNILTRRDSPESKTMTLILEKNHEQTLLLSLPKPRPVFGLVRQIDGFWPLP